MKKIKTTQEYLIKHISYLIGKGTLKSVEDLKLQPEWDNVIEAIKEAQLDMLEYAVNKAKDNARIINIYNAVDKQSILNTIDEIKKELE